MVELVPVRRKTKSEPVLRGYGMFKDVLNQLTAEEHAEAERLDREDIERWLTGE